MLSQRAQQMNKMAFLLKLLLLLPHAKNDLQKKMCRMFRGWRYLVVKLISMLSRLLQTQPDIMWVVCWADFTRKTSGKAIRPNKISVPKSCINPMRFSFYSTAKKTVHETEVLLLVLSACLVVACCLLFVLDVVVTTLLHILVYWFMRFI